jgi:hypothetical protein
MMSFDAKEILKMWIAHQKKYSKIKDIEQNLSRLVAQYNLECLECSAKALLTRTLIEDLLDEAERLVEQGLDVSFFEGECVNQDMPLAKGNALHNESSTNLAQGSKSEKPMSLADKLSMMSVTNTQTESREANLNGVNRDIIDRPVRSTIGINAPDDLTNKVHGDY